MLEPGKVGVLARDMGGGGGGGNSCVATGYRVVKLRRCVELGKWVHTCVGWRSMIGVFAAGQVVAVAANNWYQ